VQEGEHKKFIHTKNILLFYKFHVKKIPAILRILSKSWFKIDDASYRIPTACCSCRWHLFLPTFCSYRTFLTGLPRRGRFVSFTRDAMHCVSTH